MKVKNILTLSGEAETISIGQLNLNDQYYYFSFTSESHEDTPESGLRDLHPGFEKLWDSFEFDPFTLFPQTKHQLPEDIEAFLRQKLDQKIEEKVLNVFLADRWEECLMSREVDSLE